MKNNEPRYGLTPPTPRSSRVHGAAIGDATLCVEISCSCQTTEMNALLHYHPIKHGTGGGGIGVGEGGCGGEANDIAFDDGESGRHAQVCGALDIIVPAGNARPV